MGLKYAVNEKFFDTWTSESAYLVGLLCADGNLIDNPSIRAKYFSLTSIDIELVENMRALLASKHRIYKRLAYGNRKEAYLLRIGSAALFERLMHIGLTPSKTQTLVFPDMPRVVLADFVRGYFDGDGCVFLEYSGLRVKRLLTIFTSGCRTFLERLQSELIGELGVKPGKLYQHGSSAGAYQLRYSTRDSLRLFLFLYNPQPDQKLYLKRKYAIFSEYLSLRSLTVAQIPEILNTSGPVAKKKRGGLQTHYARMRFPSGPPNLC